MEINTVYVRVDLVYKPPFVGASHCELLTACSLQDASDILGLITRVSLNMQWLAHGNLNF